MFITYLVSGEIQSVLFLIYVTTTLLFYKKNLFYPLLRLTMPLCLLVLLGSLGGIIYARFSATPQDTYEIYKDIWYMIKGILAFWVGTLLMDNIETKKDVWKSIIWAAFLVAAVYLFLFFMEAAKGGFSSVRMLRKANVPPPVLFVSFACAFSLIYSDLIKGGILRPIVNIILLLCIVLSFSRLIWFSFLIMFFVMVIFFCQINIKLLVRIIIFSIIGLFFVFMSIHTFSLQKTWSNMFSKILNSFSELRVESVQRIQITKLHKVWRGFETHRAWNQYIEGEWFELFLGQGYGKTVNIGFDMRLAGKNFRQLPVLHNGYLEVLLTTGIIGIFLFFFFFLRLALFGIQAVRSKLLDISLGGKGLLIILLGICVSTFAMRGFFEKADHSLLISLGIFYSYSHQFVGTNRQALSKLLN